MSSVIVLTSNYQPWSRVSVRKAFNWYIKNKIEIIEADESRETGSLSLRIKIPLVVRLLEFVGFKPRRVKMAYKKEMVFSRDGNLCQYYHKTEKGKLFKYRCTVDELTIDHVFPQSRGGPTTYENCVTACGTCNSSKKNRTPEEAGMTLIRKPFAPTRDYVSIRLPSYNPRELSDRVYYEKFLGKAFSHVA